MFKSLSLKVIIFGFIFTFFSSFGQSFFLGLFNSSIRETLSITHGQFGSIYASATLLSSLILVWIGKKIDDVNIFKFALYVTFFLSLSCFLFSKIFSITFLFFGIFFMRLAGQGLSTHTATTTISRYFNKNRGRALSFGWLGLSAAEFSLPVLIIFLLSIMNWRDIWSSISLLVIVILPILSYFLVKEISLSSREEIDKTNKVSEKFKQWRRSEVLRDYRFYIICLNMFCMPWISTGTFVYQSFISSSKSWGPYVMAQSFMAYSILSVITLFLSGFLIDKFTSRRLLLYMNIPILIAVIILFLFESFISAFVILGLYGISNGLTNLLGSSTWAEIYGVQYIGSIKALSTAIMVFSTAFGTALFGFLIDIGFTIQDISVIAMILIIIPLVMLFSIKNKLNPTYI